MNKFKVGDKVRRIKQNNDTFVLKVGDIGTVSSVMNDWINLKEYSTDGTNGTYSQDFFELVKGTETPQKQNITHNGILSIGNSGTIDWGLKDNNINNKMNIKNFAKNLLLSKEDKILREMGLMSECGEYTSDAISIIDQKICEDNKNYLVDIATKLKEENNKNK